MNGIMHMTKLTIGSLIKVLVGIALAVFTYRSAMICQMTGALHIPLYPVVVIGASAAAIGCAVIGHIINVQKYYIANTRGGCLSGAFAVIAFIYVLASFCTAAYACVPGWINNVVHSGFTSCTGEITAVGEPHKYPQVIPFTGKQVRFDYDYKYKNDTGSATYTGSFNSPIEYEPGDDIEVRVYGDAAEDKFVFENYSADLSEQQRGDIERLLIVYLILLAFFVPFRYSGGGDEGDSIGDD